MARPIRWRQAAAGLGLAALLLAMPSVAGAADGHTPMCGGRTDPLLQLNAHAVGRATPSDPKLVLNLETDDAGRPTGTLVSGQGSTRVQVTEWCRLWTHRPDDTGHEATSDESEDGATIAHAVGRGQLTDGTRIVVRVDVKGTEEGDTYRLRYRAESSEHEEELTATEHEDDEAWVRIPAEGWSPLKLLLLRAA